MEQDSLTIEELKWQCVLRNYTLEVCPVLRTLQRGDLTNHGTSNTRVDANLSPSASASPFPFPSTSTWSLIHLNFFAPLPQLHLCPLSLRVQPSAIFP
jgi:hypothetical protein